MKTKLFNLVLAVALFATLPFTAVADNDKPINVNQLPAKAQQVMNTHFKGQKVALAKMESGLIEKSYDVILANGTKVEFDRNGSWTEVSCPATASVPTAFIPAAIANYIKSTYQGAKVLKIERDGKGYDVKLSNGTELEFNSKCQLIDID